MSKFNFKNNPLQQATKTLGSQKKLADLIGVSQQTVGRWINNSPLIPAEYCMLVEERTSGLVKAVDLRPDLPWSYCSGF